MQHHSSTIAICICSTLPEWKGMKHSPQNESTSSYLWFFYHTIIKTVISRHHRQLIGIPLTVQTIALLHTHTCHLWVVGDSHTADVVVSCCRHLSGTSCAVTDDKQKQKRILGDLHEFTWIHMKDILWVTSKVIFPQIRFNFCFYWLCVWQQWGNH